MIEKVEAPSTIGLLSFDLWIVWDVLKIENMGTCSPMVLITRVVMNAGLPVASVQAQSTTVCCKHKSGKFLLISEGV